MTEKRKLSRAAGDLWGEGSCLASGADVMPATSSREGATVPSDRRIAALAVRDLCAGISDMTLWRWLNDPELGFPRPMYIAKRRYWREAEIIAWLDTQDVA